MIKANELQIGNLFQDYEENFFEFDLQDFCNIKNSTLTIDEYCKPILITNQWLYKLGFNKHNSDVRFYQKASLKIKIHENGYQFKWYDSIVYIKYVHQLQNLYFALTNKELNIIIL